MKVLVDHGAWFNFGDVAMLQAAILRLHKLSGMQCNVVSRPSVGSSMFEQIWALDQVRSVPGFVLEPVVNRVPGMWRLPKIAKSWMLSYSLLTSGIIQTAGSHLLYGQGGASLKDWVDQYDGLYIAGGGNLTDAFAEGVWHKCALIHAFHEQGKPIILTGQQLGPFSSFATRSAVYRALNCARFVALREPTESVVHCRRAGLGLDRYEVIGDDSLGIGPCSTKETDELLAFYGLARDRFIAANIRVASYASGHGEFICRFGKALSILSQQLKMPIAIVPIATNEGDSDEASGDQLKEAIGLESVCVLQANHLTVERVKGLLGSAYGAVGVSYHFCTFALSQGIPAVCVFDGDYYAQKARGLGAFWESPRLLLPLKDMDSFAIAGQVRSVWEDDALRASIGTRATQAIDAWNEGFDRALARWHPSNS